MIKLMYLKELMVYYYFLKINFRFWPKTFNGCHALMEKAITFDNVKIVFINRNDCETYFRYIGEHETINTIKNSSVQENNISVQQYNIIKIF